LDVTTADVTQRDAQIEAVLEASRAMVAVVAHSLADAQAQITLPQWRALVVAERHGPLNMSAMAQWMGVHPSNATRACEGLVRSGLLDRREDPDDRRRQLLSLSRSGHEFVETLLEHRRRALAQVLERVPEARRKRLAAAMRDFAEAVGDAAVAPAAMPWIS